MGPHKTEPHFRCKVYIKLVINTKAR